MMSIHNDERQKLEGKIAWLQESGSVKLSAQGWVPKKRLVGGGLNTQTAKLLGQTLTL
jgi:hypothetical protein